MGSRPTWPVAAGSLIAGYAVVAVTGSRPIGGLVLLAGGLWCIRAWSVRHGARTAGLLAGVGLGAFIASHLLALAIGPWPSVLALAALTGAITRAGADRRLLAG